LRENDNKTSLFQLLSERVAAETFLGRVMMTHGEEVVSSEATNVNCVSLCAVGCSCMLLSVLCRENRPIVTRTVYTDFFAHWLGYEHLVAGTEIVLQYVGTTGWSREMEDTTCFQELLW